MTLTLKLVLSRLWSARNTQYVILSDKLWSALYPHIHTYGPQILVRVLPIDGPQVHMSAFYTWPMLTQNPNPKHTHTHTHTHNRFTALLEFVRDYPGEQVPER